MRVAQSMGNKSMNMEKAKTFFNDPKKTMKGIIENKFSNHALASFSILPDTKEICEERLKVQEKLKNHTFDKEEDRAIGVMLANVIGDALGAPLEFSPVRYMEEPELTGFHQVEFWKEKFEYNRFKLEPGQWTDDFSMAQCIADSLLEKGKFDPIDLRTRFMCWWCLGYCNAFGFSNAPRGSVGLGGNISQSFSEFIKNPTIEYTKVGDEKTSGNGSVMRNSPIPVRYYKCGLETAMDIAYKQSKTTHQGDEAAELCRLLTFVCCKGIETGNKDKVFEALEKEFVSNLYSVNCLAKSVAEERHQENNGLDLDDRDWNWKKADYKFCESRARENPGYIGSYAMDAVAMALHCVYTTDNFFDAVVKCVNLRGDADSHGAVCAQIAGSIYGASAIPEDWIQAVQQWDRNGDIALKAYKLYHSQQK